MTSLVALPGPPASGQDAEGGRGNRDREIAQGTHKPGTQVSRARGFAPLRAEPIAHAGLRSTSFGAQGSDSHERIESGDEDRFDVRVPEATPEIGSLGGAA